MFYCLGYTYTVCYVNALLRAVVLCVLATAINYHESIPGITRRFLLYGVVAPFGNRILGPI